MTRLHFQTIRRAAATPYAPLIYREYREVSMLKLVMMSLTGLLVLLLVACGTAAPDVEEAPTAARATSPPAAPTATEAPQAVSAPSSSGETLQQAAARLAGGPGAIFIGDLTQLVGPTRDPDLGIGEDGMIPLDILEGNEWIYESDYYKRLLDLANFDNPTELVTQGETIQIQYACINRALFPCKAKESYFVPNVYDRTNGQLDIQVIGYPELGIAGPDTVQLVANGTLSFSEITGAYVGGDLPVLDMYYFWGLFSDRETDFKAVTAVIDDLDGYIEDATGGGVVVSHNWYAGNDQWFFSREPLDTLDDYTGIKTRSHGTTLSDLINGLGGAAQFVAFAEVYTALERGILDAGMTGGSAGHGQRWYEVADYIVGPAISMPADLLIFNPDTWASLPEDFQQILMEEGARAELEELRMAPVWNATGLQKNIDEGMLHIPWDDEMYDYILNKIVIGEMIPNWVGRVGGPDTDEVKLFNDKFGPIAGVVINPDGTASLVDSAGGKAQN